jgi:hypothetical protein
MITSVLPVDLTWSEVYDIGSYYRTKMQHCAELANGLDRFPATKADMLGYADEAADLLKKWDALREGYYRHAIYRDEDLAA